MLGDFLEISLATRDILASIEFYRKLDFSEAPAGSTWKHPYTVMTDGRLYIGLHQRDIASPGLSFVLPDLTRRMAGFEALGLEFAICNIELHHFNELGFLDPDGQLVTLLEARTYSPVHDAHLRPTLCGYFQEYSVSVRNRAASVRLLGIHGLHHRHRERHTGALRPSRLERHQPGTAPVGAADGARTGLQPP